MSDKPGALLQKLTQNQFSRITIGSLLDMLTKEVPAAWKLLNINVDRYKQVPSVVSALPETRDLNAVYQGINEIFPTFPFVASSQLKSQPSYFAAGQQILIAALGSTVAQYIIQKPKLSLFLKNIDLSVDIGKSSAKGAKDSGYLPKLIHGDLILIAKGLQLKPSQHRYELVESYYSLRGLMQFFLRYYFDLVIESESDEVAQHIDDIFLNFFNNLHLQENQYWKSFENGQKIKAQVEYTIAKDAPATRHPVLRNPFFDQINALHPIVHDGGSRKMTLSSKKLLDEQLSAYHSLSQKKAALFLRVLTGSKAPSYPRYLLAQTLKSEPKKLLLIQEAIETSMGNNPVSVQLLQIMAPITQKLAPKPKPKPQSKPKVFLDETDKRRMTAEKNIEDRAHIAAYTSEQLEGHFKNYLDKLYDRVKKKGALTQDGIKDYLSRFNKDAVEIVQRPRITVEEKTVFEESIDETLMEMGGQLSEDEVKEYQEGVHEALENLENMDVVERVKQIEMVGDVLSAAADMSDRKKEAEDHEQIYNNALAQEIQIDDDPAHVVTIEKFLSQPIPTNEKMKYLMTHIPKTLSIETHTIIDEKQQHCAQDSSNPVSIYKGNTLLTKALTRLMFPQNNFKELLQQEIIPILPDKNAPKISVRDFFTFPFAEKKGPSDDAWFEQHVYYLKMANGEGLLGEDDMNSLVENVDNFPTLEYKKYFSIVRKEKFEDTTFMAVYCLWQNNGLDKLRSS
ncbi:MAG: hypothetical protein HQM13_22570 [SAR324 cluster bacterium]|nr:hypothetical protein [SAR324 cluster bacterium]